MGVDNFEANVFTFWSIQPSGSPYHTIQPVDSQSSQWNLAVQWKQLRSNSWSDSLDDCRVVPVLDLNRWEKCAFPLQPKQFLKSLQTSPLQITFEWYTSAIAWHVQTSVRRNVVPLELVSAESKSFKVSKCKHRGLSWCGIRNRMYKLCPSHQSSLM